MKAEEQYFIQEIEIYVTRNGRGFTDRITDSSSKETRYVIRKAFGIQMYSAKVIRSLTNEECSSASGLMHPTRKYKRELDETYFKFYDDAEEVLRNLIIFIKWLKNAYQKPVKDRKKILANSSHLIQDVASSPEWEQIKASQVGLQVKRRSDLKPLARDNQDDLDLAEESY